MIIATYRAIGPTRATRASQIPQMAVHSRTAPVPDCGLHLTTLLGLVGTYNSQIRKLLSGRLRLQSVEYGQTIHDHAGCARSSEPHDPLQPLRMGPSRRSDLGQRDRKLVACHWRYYSCVQSVLVAEEFVLTLLSQLVTHSRDSERELILHELRQLLGPFGPRYA